MLIQNNEFSSETVTTGSGEEFRIIYSEYPDENYDFVVRRYEKDSLECGIKQDIINPLYGNNMIVFINGDSLEVEKDKELLYEILSKNIKGGLLSEGNESGKKDFYFIKLKSSSEP